MKAGLAWPGMGMALIPDQPDASVVCGCSWETTLPAAVDTLGGPPLHLASAIPSDLVLSEALALSFLRLRMARMVPTMRQHHKGAVPRTVYPTIHHGKEAASNEVPPPLLLLS